jgi:signal transduction histidine kinase
MRAWFAGKPGGLLAFLLIAGLFTGGLGWATAAALRLEREQLLERAAAGRLFRLRLALLRLDGSVAPFLAREEARPFNHYSTLYPAPAVLAAGAASATVLQPSPLLQADLPPWMLLHFQADASPRGGYTSPQVPPPEVRRLRDSRVLTSLPNVTPSRSRLLAQLAAALPPKDLLAAARPRAAPATLHDTTLRLARRQADLLNDLATLAPTQKAGNASVPPAVNYGEVINGPADGAAGQQRVQRAGRAEALNAIKANGAEWLNPLARGNASSEVTINLTPMVPLWLRPKAGPPRLALVRLVNVEDLEVCQGVLLDAGGLSDLLAREVADLFPEARIVPGDESGSSEAEPAMTALPFRLDPGTVEVSFDDPGWTALRVGLLLAWVAALAATAAVGLGGWSLIDLSQRRARFVSAVTHELRTPLTTLRLYLDMLVGGMVREPERREEYLRTLNFEAERLHRLVANVLDFARLERHGPRPRRTQIRADELLGDLRETWLRHCEEAGKELVIEGDEQGVTLWTDAELLKQVLGNLIDNSCKYSRGADDRRLWVRLKANGRGLSFEVEDRGPGIAAPERRAIFRAFRRGRDVETTAGGVGLGLALARRWAEALGGRLVLATTERGACFRLELPRTADPGRPT